MSSYIPFSPTYKVRPANIRPRAPPITYNPINTFCPQCRSPLSTQKHILTCSQINGNNGSATNTDDHAQHVSPYHIPANRDPGGHFLSPLLPHAIDAVDAASHLLKPVSDYVDLPAAYSAVQSAPDRFADWFMNSQAANAAYALADYISPPQPLVGVETNPGPRDRPVGLSFDDLPHENGHDVHEHDDLVPQFEPIAPRNRRNAIVPSIPRNQQPDDDRYTHDPDSGFPPGFIQQLHDIQHHSNNMLPQKMLVGIEPNPGPPKMHTKHKTEKKAKAKRPAKKQARTTKTIVKSRPLPKGIRGAAKVDSREQRIAKQYATFLRNPVFAPPRLGSSGSTPTQLVHGYFRKSYNMSAPFSLLTNSTCVTACINPVLFRAFNTLTEYQAPITICFTNAGNVLPNLGNAVGDTAVVEFTNAASLKNQVLGTTTLIGNAPLARFVGGCITLECRCPLTTTAPPYMFGGTLSNFPIDSAANKNVPAINPSQQLSAASPDALRALPNSIDVPGMTVSNYYYPSDANSLLFNPLTARNSGNIIIPPATIPYVGMVNCPTSAIVTVSVSGWFEVQPFTLAAGTSPYITTADYGGWKLGPKVSAEDIFDHLPTFRSLSTRILGTGSKTNTVGSSAYSALFANASPPPKTLEEKFQELEEKYQKLSLRIEDEEEKYVSLSEPSPSNTPLGKNRDLSQSTIDLARSIKLMQSNGSKATPKSTTWSTT